MKNNLTLFIYSLPALALSIGAIVLAYHSLPGWGWFLFASFCLMPGRITYKPTDDKSSSISN